MNFCPRCGTSLVMRVDGGRPRPTCPSVGCGFTHYGDHSIGTGAVVLREGRILLIERRTGDRRWWQIPGGYVEVDEEIHAGIEREVLEETGVQARVIDVLGFRHAAGVQGERPASNIYVVFRLQAESGEPRPDGVESFSAAFFTPDEIAQRPGISALSMWAIDSAYANAAARGFRLEALREGLQRSGHSIFGLRPER